MAASQRILLGHVKGDKGDKGDDGDAATIRVVGTNTAAPGAQASVIQSGTPQARELTFNIPQGLPGSGGAGGLNLRSGVVPLVYRIPVDWPFAPSVVLGAMDTHGWGSGAFNYSGRVYYFTTHATQGLVDGWVRTRRNPLMEPVYRAWHNSTQYTDWPMWRQRDCPVNFGTSGYRGNWSRHMSHFVVDESISGYYHQLWSRAADWDGLVVTNSNRALWLYARGSDETRRIYTEAITLPGLTTAAVTSMWAGVHTALIGGASRIWVIQNNRLYLCHILHNTPPIMGRPGPGHPWEIVTPGVHRRITGAADFTFVEVTDSALPALSASSRVYAEGQYAAVWTGGSNSLAFFDGTQWYPLTVPFTFSGGWPQNCVLVFANGRLGVYDTNWGDYYTCDNPSAGAAADFDLRYRTRNGMLMTNGFNRGVPQFIYRGSSHSIVYSQFNGASEDGQTSYVNPRGTTQNMAWPNELYCSTSRPDIVPSTSATHGYAYPWGTRISNVNVSDRNTLLTTAYYSSQYWLSLPPDFAPGIPNAYTDGQYRRVGPFRQLNMFAPHPNDYMGHVLDIYIGQAAQVLF